MTIVQKADENKIKSRETLNIQPGKSTIQKSLRSITLDLTYLAEYNERNDVFAPGNQAALDRMKQDLQIFSQQKGPYDQIHYPDVAGDERIRS